MFHQIPSLAIFDQVYFFLYLFEVVICNIKLHLRHLFCKLKKPEENCFFFFLARLDYKTDIGHMFSYGSVFVVI